MEPSPPPHELLVVTSVALCHALLVPNRNIAALHAIKGPRSLIMTSIKEDNAMEATGAIMLKSICRRLCLEEGLCTLGEDR